MKKILILVPFLLLCRVPLSADDDSILRVGGSDFLGAAFSEALEGFGREEGIALEIELKGSYAARSQLRDGGLDLAILAVPSREEDSLEGYEAHVFAYQTVAFGVHRDNPLNELSLNQIAGIFGAEEQTSHTRWGDLGLGGDLRPRSIALHSIAPGRSIAVDLFRFEVLRNPRLRGGVTYHDSMGALAAAVDDSLASLALLPRIPSDGRPLRTLALAREDEGIAFGPSRENVHSGDYPIRLPVYLVFHPEQAERVRELLIFLTREDVAEAVEEAGLVPLPTGSRNRLRFDFEAF